MRTGLELAVVFRRSYRCQTVGHDTITHRLATVATTVFIVCITLLAQTAFADLITPVGVIASGRMSDPENTIDEGAIKRVGVQKKGASETRKLRMILHKDIIPAFPAT